jgi:hypothetical protein
MKTHVLESILHPSLECVANKPSIEIEVHHIVE